VKVKCFGCTASIEADGADAVADAFVVHGQESHSWSYPEEAIRNYARNYAEASERLTASTERLPEIGDMTVHPVTDDRVGDWRSVIGVSCFVIAPPFRRHGLASALLDRVIADASARGASWIEGYPLNAPDASDAGHFRGPRSMYDARGFEPIAVRECDTVVRRAPG